MKIFKLTSLNLTALFACCAFMLVSCDRDLSDDVEFASFPTEPGVFLDGFSGSLLYLPFAGSKLDAFTVDDETFFEGTTSMRFDVPNVGDPDGAFAGAIFPDASGRNLTGFDALTFYAKATKSATLNEVGFGNDFGLNRYQVTKTNLQLTTNWVKYTIPIPDPSRLVSEFGMFWYSEGPEDGEGYTFWVDELRYEKLGTVAQPRPAIYDGEDRIEQTFIGAVFNVPGTQTFNLGSGLNETVSAAPSYFTFTSSDNSVATVNELGVVNVLSQGTAVITASLAGVRAAGSLTVESLGVFEPAPSPTRDPATVISIFSDAYNNVPVDFYNGFFFPVQTTLGGADLTISGNNIIRYTNINFVASEFKNPTINATEMTHLHVDIQIENPVGPADFVAIELGDFGADRAFGGGDDSSGRLTITSDRLSTRTWISLDIPLADFGLSSRANLAQIFFVTDGSNPDLPGSITEMLVDNIYFYRQ